ncbi:hypothetical protein M2281_002847 [Mesorhizobium soli]|nr:hypothetical protein [Mesorhizobium soli]
MFSGRHFERSVILLCVRWYLAYNLSLRNLEEMMAERGIRVDHSTIHRWVVRFSPLLLEGFNQRKRAVTDKWHVDETYVKVSGRWMYLYRAIDSAGDTLEFFFSKHRDLVDTKRFLRRALRRHGLAGVKGYAAFGILRSSARGNASSMPLAEVSNGVFNLGVADQDLHCSKIASGFVDDRNLGAPKRIHAVILNRRPNASIQCPDHPGILPLAYVG